MEIFCLFLSCRFENVLRKKYVTETGKPKRSGSGLESEEWEHMNALSFLDKTIKRRKGKSNISVSNPSETENDSLLSDETDDTSERFEALDGK